MGLEDSRARTPDVAGLQSGKVVIDGLELKRWSCGALAVDWAAGAEWGLPNTDYDYDTITIATVLPGSLAVVEWVK